MFYTKRHNCNVSSWAHFLTGVCIMLLPLLYSCSADNHDIFEEEEIQNTGERTNLKLILNINSDPNNMTRVSDNPMGGEDGNGLRHGEHHENDIENLCIFAFTDDGEVGITNLNAETPIKYCRFVDDVDFHPTHANTYYNDKYISTEVDIEFEGRIVSKTDAFLILANMGDVTTSVTKLGQLRDLLVNKTLTRPSTPGAPLSECTCFTMSNASNSRSMGGTGTKETPYRVAVDLERTTARVDFWYQNGLEDSNKPDNLPVSTPLGYKVVNPNDNTEQTGWMYITHIKLMNVAHYAPYALKRLAQRESDAPTYLANEEHINDEATHYVIEPHTWDKSKRGIVTYEQLYGNTRIQYASSNYAMPGFFTTQEAVHPYATPQIAPNASDGFNQGWSKDAITGEAYYVLDYINENTVEKEYTSGLNTTSLLIKAKYIPKSMYFIEGGTLKTKAARYGDTFWMMEKMESGVRQKLYFETEATANRFKTDNPTATYTAPVLYTNGDCYYTIWIRHDNNNVETTIGKMEYGIVRNNIYRIGVNKVVGPGTVAPSSNENPEDINTRIYVRKWNVINIPTINI